MRSEFGFCICCDKEIALPCEKCDIRKPNEHYTEVLMKLNNGSQMVLAVCSQCAVDNEIHNKDKKELMDAVKAGWLATMKRSPKQVIDTYKEKIKDWEFVD